MLHTVDFETEPITPGKRPMPVSVSIKSLGRAPKFYAWGHKTGGNPHTMADAKKALAAIWQHPLVFHNSKFDVGVAAQHMRLPMPNPATCYDTMLELFLDDPNQRDLSLKPSAERLLGMKPEERDAVADWLVEHQPVPSVRITHKSAIAYTAWCPARIVRDYCNGDVVRTEALHQLLYPRILQRGMGEAYLRERQVMPVLLDMEAQGVRVDAEKLGEDVKAYMAAQARADAWLIKRLHAPKDINLNSGEQLVDAMVQAGVAQRSDLGITEKGNTKHDKKAYAGAVKDKTLLGVLNYRGRLLTALHTFMEPWLAQAQASNGYIYNSWNQVKQSGGDGSVGARTGRLSSSPNLQNIPKVFQPVFQTSERKELPKCPIKDLLPLPNVRQYIVADKGWALIGRDYSQQEVRILAHYEDGALLAAYLGNPWLDIHDTAGQMIYDLTGKRFPRSIIKTLGFGLIYGMGVSKLAEQCSIDYATAKEAKQSYLAVFPGIREINAMMKAKAGNDQPFRTWGGREVYCEPPIVKDSHVQTFDYKMLNYLIQGSAADCTKEAMVAYAKGKRPQDRLLVSVHDELLCQVPLDEVKAGMEALRVSMEGVKFDLPMLSEGKWSAGSWAAMKPYDKKGVLLEA